MLSNKDLKGYFDQMSKLETDMHYLYKDCSEKVGEEEIKKIFSALSRSEAQHQLLVKKAMDLLQK